MNSFQEGKAGSSAHSLPGRPESLWIGTAGEACYPALEGSISVDVAILGAGKWPG
ncbi:MAG: hypothetical protein AB1611_09230 [bacterium]